MESSDIEDAIELIDTVPAPQPKHTEISAHLRHRIVTTKFQALEAKEDRLRQQLRTPRHKRKELQELRMHRSRHWQSLSGR